jgi:hypothetical protein
VTEAGGWWLVEGREDQTEEIAMANKKMANRNIERDAVVDPGG